MHEAFVEPSKKNADIIVPNGGLNEVASSMIIEKIKSILNASK
jgi:uridine kinase